MCSCLVVSVCELPIERLEAAIAVAGFVAGEPTPEAGIEGVSV